MYLKVKLDSGYLYPVSELLVWRIMDIQGDRVGHCLGRRARLMRVALRVEDGVTAVTVTGHGRLGAGWSDLFQRSLSKI